jgi:hypothetical protein
MAARMTDQMDRQTKVAFTILGVLILFIVALYLFGDFSGWYEVE